MPHDLTQRLQQAAATQEVPRSTQQDIKNTFKTLERTLASMLSKSEGVKRKYTHGFGRPFGRKYSPLGLQAMKNPVASDESILGVSVRIET